MALTALRIAGPWSKEPSETLQFLAQVGGIHVARAEDYHLEITFDQQAARRRVDLEPVLPVTLSF